VQTSWSSLDDPDKMKWANRAFAALEYEVEDPESIADICDELEENPALVRIGVKEGSNGGVFANILKRLDPNDFDDLIAPTFETPDEKPEKSKKPKPASSGGSKPKPAETPQLSFDDWESFCTAMGTLENANGYADAIEDGDELLEFADVIACETDKDLDWPEYRDGIKGEIEASWPGDVAPSQEEGTGDTPGDDGPDWPSLGLQADDGDGEAVSTLETAAAEHDLDPNDYGPWLDLAKAIADAIDAATGEDGDAEIEVGSVVFGAVKGKAFEGKVLDIDDDGTIKTKAGKSVKQHVDRIELKTTPF
jgi:hypothetical protein